MSLEENKAIVRKMVEASNKKDLAVIDEFTALDFVDQYATYSQSGEFQLVHDFTRVHSGLSAGSIDWPGDQETTISRNMPACIWNIKWQCQAQRPYASTSTRKLMRCAGWTWMVCLRA